MFKPLVASLSATLLLGSILAISPLKAEDAPAITKEDLSRSADNLRQIGLAFHSYSKNYNSLPSDILNKNGKPLLSWRVTILRYIGEEELFKQFALDEPWDGADNKKLIEKMPTIYAPVRVKAKAGETFYQTFTGEGTVFVKHLPVYTISTIPDGTSATGMVFEAGEPVIWSKPADLLFDEKKPLPKLGGLFDGEFHVVMFDGFVCHFRKDPDEKELKKVIMADDAQPVDLSKLGKPRGGS